MLRSVCTIASADGGAGIGRGARGSRAARVSPSRRAVGPRRRRRTRCRSRRCRKAAAACPPSPRRRSCRPHWGRSRAGAIIRLQQRLAQPRQHPGGVAAIEQAGADAVVPDRANPVGEQQPALVQLDRRAAIADLGIFPGQCAAINGCRTSQATRSSDWASHRLSPSCRLIIRYLPSTWRGNSAPPLLWAISPFTGQRSKVRKSCPSRIRARCRRGRPRCKCQGSDAPSGSTSRTRRMSSSPRD